MFKLVLPWFWPWPEKSKPEVEWPEWNQERISFENGLEEPSESPREQLLRLSPSLGDLKKLVL